MATSRKVVVVGGGALGSHFIQAARNWSNLEGGVTITLIDFDRVETKNIASQFHSNMTRGKNKALGLKTMLQGLFGVSIDAVPHKLTKDNVEALLGGSALVVDCTDNGEARVVIQTFVRENKIACLHGALSADGSCGRAVWDDLFKIDHESAPGLATCENSQNVPFHIVAGAWLAVVGLRFLTLGEKRSYQILPTGMQYLG